jgi:hypothetical protein
VISVTDHISEYKVFNWKFICLEWRTFSVRIVWVLFIPVFWYRRQIK